MYKGVVAFVVYVVEIKSTYTCIVCVSSSSSSSSLSLPPFHHSGEAVDRHWSLPRDVLHHRSAAGE